MVAGRWYGRRLVLVGPALKPVLVFSGDHEWLYVDDMFRQ